MKNIGLYIVTDSKILKDKNFYDCIEDTLKAGVKIIQLREKNEDGLIFLEKAKKLRKITKKYDAKLIINDRVDIAILSDADGVHIGQHDIPIKDVRTLIGNEKIIGVSVSNLDQAIQAQKEGANYLGIGAMFQTLTKLDAREVTNDELKKIKNVIDLPIISIGGINLENIKTLEKCDGYAVISAILKEDNIQLECRKFIDKINKII